MTWLRASEIAERCEVRHRTVYRWTKQLDFPSSDARPHPRTTQATAYYRWDQVRDWLVETARWDPVTDSPTGYCVIDAGSTTTRTGLTYERGTYLSRSGYARRSTS